ncbi:MAG: squalene/phytoene synthase family protein [Alphaproteobacteria bacterium]|nr:squalene/phytoene synthase family protein [Alphaproteobacteria bacterium]MBV9694278.1 squalene/phytoene synthase family protein [Alphaproteobacteria bacterium]
MSAAAFEACAQAVRRADPDRHLSALFAPATKRPLLLALYAFNLELARIATSVREPMMGEIRLQWWRESVDLAHAGKPRAHDAVQALAALFAATGLPTDLFHATIDARQFDLLDGAFADEAQRDTYLDGTSANVMRLAARILGAGDSLDDLAREAGLAYGLAGLLRNRAHGHRRLVLADPTAARRDARRHWELARRRRNIGPALAAFLPAALVPLFLRDPAKPVALHRRQLALLAAALRGRL